MSAFLKTNPVKLTKEEFDNQKQEFMNYVSKIPFLERNNYMKMFERYERLYEENKNNDEISYRMNLKERYYNYPVITKSDELRQEIFGKLICNIPFEVTENDFEEKGKNIFASPNEPAMVYKSTKIPTLEKTVVNHNGKAYTFYKDKDAFEILNILNSNSKSLSVQAERTHDIDALSPTIKEIITTLSTTGITLTMPYHPSCRKNDICVEAYKDKDGNTYVHPVEIRFINTGITKTIEKDYYFKNDSSLISREEFETNMPEDLIDSYKENNNIETENYTDEVE